MHRNLERARDVFGELEDVLVAILERDASAYALKRLRWIGREFGIRMETTEVENRLSD